ncbi:MAG: endopeptidase La, partial [Planctomycetes bacterium]|nr:endopeptidase La [Planctomycetota bacterium]
MPEEKPANPAPGAPPAPPGLPEVLGVLPVRGLVFFPFLTVPLMIGRPRSLKLIDEVLPGEDKMIAVVSVKAEGEESEEPAPSLLHRVGTAVRILRMAKLAPDRYQILGQGLMRIRIGEFRKTEPYLAAKVEAAPEKAETGPQIEAMGTNLKAQFRKWAELREIPAPLVAVMEQEENLLGLVYLIGAQLGLPGPELQALLEADSLAEKIRRVTEKLTAEVDRLALAGEIQQKIKDGMEKNQREYLLREQLKQIQKELGDEDPQAAEAKELRRRAGEADLPEEARKTADRELDRLARMPPAAAEVSVSRTYLDWILDLPWKKETKDVLDVPGAAKVLDEDHYDLAKVKQRILEYLAVRKLKADMKGPILCFAGPPGVGKTSLGQSIARALGRKFVRLSLGGVHDEAEIRGHRRTYVGALPGRILQGIRKAGTRNPVFMLDEVDKIGADFRGDPSSALLEVLDPEQNHSFSDHYLEIPFDLSRVLFITTANVLQTIPPPLLDRMEVLELPGYTEEEKVRIARTYLVPRQLRENGLGKRHLSISDAALLRIVRSWTREAGVRNLERMVGAVCRKTATRVASGKRKPVRVGPADLEAWLGPLKFLPGTEVRQWGPGLSAGLAWTPVGGEVLYVEATRMPGRGHLTLTGQLGDVMKESATAAFSYLKSHADEFGIPAETLEKSDVHLHIPSGAIPKDGPSAGVAMLTALASLMLGKPADKKVCMTGEVTLRGDVLPVGGIKEKVLAARREGILTVVLPRLNEKDLDELPPDVRRGMKFVLAERMEKALARTIP